MRKLCLHPLFFVGLAIRIVLIAVLAPRAISDWYVPFMEFSTSRLMFDPWSAWLANGGVPAAFPYGYAMWALFLPLSLGAKLLGLHLQYGYLATLLIADLLLLLLLHRFLPGRQRLLLVAYWLSPIVILASYGFGLNDLVPALLLMLSLYFVRSVRLIHAGAICAAAISAKLSMVLALPLLGIYLFNNRAMRQYLPEFTSSFLICFGILEIPFLLSDGGVKMLLGNPEIGKVFSLAFSLGGAVSIYVVPLAYLVMLYMAWRVRRLNFELFQATTGMAFLLIVLLTPASPGWFVWSIPFLVLYQAMSGRVAIALSWTFSGLYVLGILIDGPLRLAGGGSLDLAETLSIAEGAGAHTVSLLHTAMVAVGAILAIRIWREAISWNDYFRLSRKPFVIGVAGDSGAGKDTFADAIAGLFGGHSVSKLSGDDYHLWDRQKPMWQVMTHLNPMANDLEAYCNDLVALADGKSIQSRHYDHQSGRMGKPCRIRSNDFIIASGLHALYLPMLRKCYDLSIYLDIDEDLRRYFKLKRDVRQRGHAVESVLSLIEKRVPDSERFIRPQSAYADLILSLQPIHPKALTVVDDARPLRLKLSVCSRHGLNELSLTRVLIGVCGLHVDMTVSGHGSEVLMTIEGDTTAADVALAARLLCPRILEFLDVEPQWQDGVVGLMQLITLSHVSQALTRRFL